VRLPWVCGVLVASVALVSGSPVGASGASFYYFRMPSNNIYCAYMKGGGISPELRCDMRTPLKPLPRKPRSCQFDWGGGYSLSPRGTARVLCVSDSVYKNGSPVLRYGSKWHKDAFTCFSKRIGLRCVNAARHGFFLSTQHSYRF
jgi:hypothetical protein